MGKKIKWKPITPQSYDGSSLNFNHEDPADWRGVKGHEGLLAEIDKGNHKPYGTYTPSFKEVLKLLKKDKSCG